MYVHHQRQVRLSRCPHSEVDTGRDATGGSPVAPNRSDPAGTRHRAANATLGCGNRSSRTGSNRPEHPGLARPPRLEVDHHIAANITFMTNTSCELTVSVPRLAQSRGVLGAGAGPTAPGALTVEKKSMRDLLKEITFTSSPNSISGSRRASNRGSAADGVCGAAAAGERDENIRHGGCKRTILRRSTRELAGCGYRHRASAERKESRSNDMHRPTVDSGRR